MVVADWRFNILSMFFMNGLFFVCAPWPALTGVSPEHAQVVGNV